MEEVKIADCCGSVNWQYMYAGGKWHFILWIPMSQQGEQTTWKCIALDATHCHNCGSKLDEVDVRHYFPGVFEPIDDIVRRLEV